MPTKDPFVSLIPALVDSIILTIEAKHSQAGWLSACYQEAHAADGGSAIRQLRITLVGGHVDASLSLTDDMSDAMSDAWEKLFKRKKKSVWFGFKLLVFPDGTSKEEYSTDPNIIDDPEFYQF